MAIATHERRRLRMFLSEFVLPTDHANFEFNFWVTRADSGEVDQAMRSG